MSLYEGNGWSLRVGDALRLIDSLEDASVDMLLCDPPYSSGGMFRGDRTMNTNDKYVGTDVKLKDARALFDGDNRDQRSYLAWCGLWLEAARQKVRPGGLVGVFADWRQLPTVTDAIQVGGWIWRGILGWDKTEGIRPQLGRFRQQLEFVIWGSNGPRPTSEGRVAPGCYRASRDEESREHATGKPVGVMQWLLSLLEPGALVLDPFAGSGSTGVACLRRGLRFIGFELSPQIAVLASERLAAESGAVDRDGVQMSMLGELASAVTP